MHIIAFPSVRLRLRILSAEIGSDTRRSNDTCMVWLQHGRKTRERFNVWACLVAATHTSTWANRSAIRYFVT